METLKAFQLEQLMMYHLASLKHQCLVLLILPNLEKSLVVKKMYDLVNMSDVLKVSLYVPCLDLLKAVMNIVHLVNLYDLQKDLRMDLYLD